MSTAEIVRSCQALYDDLDFTAARDWKAAAPGRKVIGYLPVYVPRELIHAAGMLPLGGARRRRPARCHPRLLPDDRAETPERRRRSLRSDDP